MDLKLFFNPIDESLSDKSFKADSLIQSVYLNEEKLPDILNIDIAIIGIKENNGYSTITDTGVRFIRKKLYSLKRSNSSTEIVDLGNLRSGPSREETYKRLKAVCQYLMHKQILPIIIGGSHDIDLGQFLAYEEDDKLISICNVDSHFDMDNQTELPSENHIHTMINHNPNFLFNYSHLGYQSYFVSPTISKIFKQLNFSTYRIGEMREDFKKVEPVIRESDMLSFDISAIQKAYTPAGNKSDVFGLTGEEACQIMWYAGLNDKLSSVGIYEYNPEKDTNDHQSAQVIAVMIWYFIEGFNNRKGEKGFQTNDYMKYVVTMDNEPDAITFYKSRLSDKWWMEVPNLNNKSIYERNTIVPCDHNDYNLALNGEIPDRWIKVFSKHS
ncbi:formimidoylglutamase [Reichenbachiella versicolor]|uniref:formimidoylglutamase n=1 Tax=Reichenbachiella versicolor TaxID=1821036 RepID=UPI000D6EA4AA|nr:formimidoylglutamase [Reichenbachiella versicolor]